MAVGTEELLPQCRHSQPLATTEAWERRLNECSSGLAQHRGPG